MLYNALTDSLKFLHLPSFSYSPRFSFGSRFGEPELHYVASITCKTPGVVVILGISALATASTAFNCLPRAVYY